MIEAQHYSELGRLLRYRREERRLELRRVAQQLHIRTRYLEALESGALEDIPGDVYVKGYLARYAAFLGLPATEAVEAYVRIGALPQRRLFYIPERMRRGQHPGSALVLCSTAAALLLALVWSQTHGVAAMHQALVLTPPIAATVRAQIRAPQCLREGIAAWPPCYHEREPLFSLVARTQPLPTILELGL
jgi:cytoskeleton protein RodZ